MLPTYLLLCPLTGQLSILLTRARLPTSLPAGPCHGIGRKWEGIATLGFTLGGGQIGCQGSGAAACWASQARRGIEDSKSVGALSLLSAA